MKIVLRVIALFFAMSGVVLLIQLNGYVKKYAKESLEAHKSYINPRMIALSILVIMADVLNMIAAFLP